MTTRRTESRPTLPVPAEPGIPAHAPESAKAIAFALDRVTGGRGEWLFDDLAASMNLGTSDAAVFETTADLHKFLGGST